MRHGHATQRLAMALGLAVATGYAALFIIASSTGRYDEPGGLVVAAAVTLLGLVAVARLAARERDPLVRRIIFGSALLKVGAIAANYLVTFEVYGGGDASLYHRRGEVIARQLWASDTSILFEPSSFSGTPFMELLTGLAYTLIGPTRLGGFFLFGAFAWVGVYLLWRAFDMSVPGGHRRRYAALLFLLPSVLYWPANIGKESWQLLMLGLIGYGLAKLLSQRSGVILLTGGLVGATLMRPHIGVLVLVGIFGSLALASQRSRLGMGPRLAIAVVLLVAGVFVGNEAQNFFGVDDVGATSVGEVLERTQENTTTGASAFEAPSLRDPVSLLAAPFTVLFRPFPFEAENAQALLLSFEGLALMVLFIRYRASLKRIGRAIRRFPYIGFTATYSAAYIAAFSTFGNFGLLARQRVLLYPLVLSLLALAEHVHRDEEATAVVGVHGRGELQHAQRS